MTRKLSDSPYVTFNIYSQRFVFANFDVIVPLIKSVRLLKSRTCLSDIAKEINRGLVENVIQKQNFRKIAEFKNKRVAKMLCNMVHNTHYDTDKKFLYNKKFP